MTPISRGEVYEAELPGLGRRPVVIVTREVAIPVLSSLVVALVTGTIRGVGSEVPVDIKEGLDFECAVNCDNVLLLPKSSFVRRRGTLGSERIRELDDALRFSLGLD